MLILHHDNTTNNINDDNDDADDNDADDYDDADDVGDRFLKRFSSMIGMRYYIFNKLKVKRHS